MRLYNLRLFMFKKVLLTLCLSAFLSWAQDDFDEDDEGFISAPAAAQEGDEGGSHAKIARGKITGVLWTFAYKKS